MEPIKTLTIGMPDLDYVWMIFSQALHMESCAFVQMIYDGNPWHGIIRHTELKELSFKDVLNNSADTFPAALSDVLVLPNLVSLLIDLEGDALLFGRLPIIPIVSLIMRSKCRLTKLVLKAPLINGSLITLLKETASLVHLEVHTLLLADIESLTIDKTDGKQPITPCLRVIHLTKIDDIADPSAINDLIRSRQVDAEVPHLVPIQDMQLHFVVPSRAHQVYGKLRGLPWMPEYNGLEYGLAVKWANALRTFTARPVPPKNEVSISIILSNFVDLDHLEGYFCDKRHPSPNGAVESNQAIIPCGMSCFTSCFIFINSLDGKTSLDIYDNLVYIHSLDGDSLGLNSWSHLQKKIRLLLDSWAPLVEKYGMFPHRNWKWRELDQRHSILYTYSAPI